MKMIEVKCPNCNGQLSISEDRKDCYCEFCGTHILIDDEVKRSETVIRDEAKLREIELEATKREELKEKIAELEVKSKDARRWKKIDWFIAIGIALCSVLFIVGIYVDANSKGIVFKIAVGLAIADIVLLIASIPRMLYRWRYDNELESAKTRLNLMDLKDVNIFKRRK